MRVRLPIPAAAALLLSLALAACGGGDDQGPVDRPPTAELRLGITAGLRLENDGIPITTFSLNPLGCADDVTRRHRLQVRYDLEDDGVWDTDWAPLEHVDGVAPDPLPTEVWRARMEVRDEAGQVSRAAASRPLPDWLTPGPNLGAGHVEVRWRITADPYAILELEAYAVVWGWNLPSYGPVACELRLDGAPVASLEAVPVDVLNRDGIYDGPTCLRAYGASLLEHWTPGTHEVALHVDVDDAVAEADETDNVSTVTASVPGPARVPARP